MAGKTVGTISISLQLLTAQLQSGINTATKQLDGIKNSATKLGSSLNLALTVPLVGLGAAAIKAFSDFDKAMTGTIASFSGVTEQIKSGMSEAAIEISKALPVSAVDAANALGQLGRAGLTAAQSVAALPVVAELAVATQTDMATSTKALTQVQFALGLSFKDPIQNMQAMTRLGDVFATANKDSGISVEGLSTALSGQLLGSMRTFGQTLNDVVPLIEVLSKEGMVGQRAGMQLAQMMQLLSINALKNADAFKAQNVAIYNSDGSMKSLVTIIQELQNHYKNLSPAQKAFELSQLGFKSRNATVIEGLIGTGSALSQLQKDLQNSGGSMQAMALTQMSSFSSQMQLLWNNIKAVGIVIGSDLAPKLLSLVSVIEGLLEKFQTLSPQTRNLIEDIAIGAVALAAIAIPVKLIAGLFSSLGTVVRVIVIPAFTGLAVLLSGILWPLFTTLLAIFGAVAAAIAGLGAPILILGAALSIAAIEIYANWGKVKEFFTQIATGFLDEWSAAIKAVSGVFTTFFNWFNTTWTAFLGQHPYIANAVTYIGGILDALVAAFQAAFTSVLNYATDFATKLYNKIKSAIPSASDVGNTVLNGAISALTMGAASSSTFGLGGQSSSAAAAQDSMTAAQQANVAVSTEQSSILGTLSDKIGSIVKGFGAGASTGGIFNSMLGLMHGSLDQTQADFDATTPKIKQAETAVADLNKQLLEVTDSQANKALALQIDTAIRDLNQADLSGLEQQVYTNTYNGSEAALAKLVQEAAPKIGLAAAQSIADGISGEKAQIAVDEISKRMQEKMQAAFQSSVSFWESTINGAIGDSGGIIDFLKSSLKQVAVGFAAQMLAAMTGVNVVGGFGGIGQQLASGIGFGSSGGQGIQSILGLGGATLAGSASGGAVQSQLIGQEMIDSISGGLDGGASTAAAMTSSAAALGGVTTAASGASTAMSGLAAGIGAYIPYVAAAVAAVKIGQDYLDKEGGKNVLGISGKSASESDYINTFMLGFDPGQNYAFKQLGIPSVGQLISGQGPPNATTIAQEGVAAYLKQITGGQDFAGFNNSHQFNSGGSGFANLQKGTAQQQNDFGALGNELNLLSGSTKDVGSHIAAILDTDLNGSLEKAVVLTQQLGVSQQQMLQDVVQEGVKAGETWQQIAGQVAGVNDLFTPGAGITSMNDALQELITSGNIGQQALTGLANVAFEAGKLGAKSLGDLANQLTAILGPQQTQIFMEALKNLGITSLSQLSSMSQQTEIALLGMLQTLGFTFQQVAAGADKASAAVQGIGTSADGVDAGSGSSSSSGSNFPSSTPSTNGSQQSARAGGKILKFHRNGITGAAVFPTALGSVPFLPTVNMPSGMSSSGGGMAADNSVNIHIDARGATPGVEQRIMQVIQQVQKQTLIQAVNTMDRRYRRGGRTRQSQ